MKYPAGHRDPEDCEWLTTKEQKQIARTVRVSMT